MQFSRQDSWVFAASFARVVTDIFEVLPELLYMVFIRLWWGGRELCLKLYF